MLTACGLQDAPTARSRGSSPGGWLWTLTVGVPGLPKARGDIGRVSVQICF